MPCPGQSSWPGYRIFLYGTGPLTVPADIKTVIEGTNTVEGTQTTNKASDSISMAISDPTPGNRNSGDESATPGQLDVTYADQTWTAGASGTINFRENTVTRSHRARRVAAASSSTPSSEGAIPVEFDCSPGTVSGPDPGVVTFTDPAVSLASTQNVNPQCKKLEKQLKKAKKAHNKAEVKKIRKKIRKLGC